MEAWNKTAPQSAPSAPQPVTQFSAPATKSAVPPLTPQQQGNILWGVAAAASVGAWTAETQRKKKEKEEAARAARAAETAERSKAYSQIAKAYSASKAAFKAAVKNAQAIGLSKQEADQLLHQVNTTGTIGGALSTVQTRTKQLEASRRAAEQRMLQQEQREEMEWQQRQAEEAQKQFDDWLRTGKNPPPGFEDVSPQERAEMYRETPEYQARQQALKGAQQAALREQSQQDFRAGERAEGYSQTAPAPKKKTWLSSIPFVGASLDNAYQDTKQFVETKVIAPVKKNMPKVMDWIDKHQVEISIGVGVVVGVAAIILSGGAVTPLVAAAWIAGAAAVAGGTVALGTVGLNAYYNRPLGTNVLRNFGYAACAAAVTVTAGFALNAIAAPVTKAIGTFCSAHITTCVVAAPVFKTVDYGWTTYDVWQAERILDNNQSNTTDRLTAGLTIALSGLEFLEPDELLPVNLPLDDVLRREITQKFSKEVAENGLESGIKFLRKELGDKETAKVIRSLYDNGLLNDIHTFEEWNDALSGVRQGADLEVHHLIEQRLAKKLGLDTDQIPSVVLDKQIHQKLTNDWLEEIARINSAKSLRTDTATADDVWKAAQEVYADYPEYLEAVRQALGR